MATNEYKFERLNNYPAQFIGRLCELHHTFSGAMSDYYEFICTNAPDKSAAGDFDGDYIGIMHKLDSSFDKMLEHLKYADYTQEKAEYLRKIYGDEYVNKFFLNTAYGQTVE